MVDLYSDQQLESQIQSWMQSPEGEFYLEKVPLYLDRVKDGCATLDLDEKLFNLHFDLSDGYPTEIESPCQNEKVADCLVACNEKLLVKEVRGVEEGMRLLCKTYLHLVLGRKNVAFEGYTHRQNEDEMMFNQGDKDDDDMVDWGLCNDDEEMVIDYQEQIMDIVAQEKMQEIKELGVIDTSAAGIFHNVLNCKSIRLFTQTKFYKEIQEALEYLQNEEETIKGWLNLVVIKEFLTVRAEIDLNYIDFHPSNCNLFGWKLDEPLIVTLDVSEAKLLNTSEDELPGYGFAELWNMGMIQYNSINAASTQSFGCNDYMRKVFERFITQSLMAKDVNEEEEKHRQLKQYPKQKNQGLIGSVWNKLFSSKIDDEAFAQLVEMGFDLKVAKRNLKKANNDIGRALDFIREEQFVGSANVLEKEDEVIKQTRYVSFTKNQIIRMMLFISDQLENANRKCILCQKPLESDSIKLRTCTQEQCEFTQVIYHQQPSRFEESFKGTILTELQFNTEAATLDLAIAAKALFSSRNAQVFEPFPTFFLLRNEVRGKRGNLDEIKKAQTQGMDVSSVKKTDEKNKDLLLMLEIMQKLPRVQNLIKDVKNEDELISKLQTLYDNPKKGWKAYKLLSYIFATNRSTIRKLKADEHVKFENDNFEQYILIQQDSRKERIFLQGKQQHGSVFCWHGSSMENWYSILRNGLRNLSNTSLMTAGAAYGAGIYASSQYTTSYAYTTRYSQGHKIWINMGAGLEHSFIIAVCEIIKKKEYAKDQNYNIAVIPDEDDIIIRYLFVLKNSSYGNSIDSLKIDFEKHYQQVMKTINEERAKERINRIQQAYQKYQERKKKQIEDSKKIEEQTSLKIQEADEKELEDKFKTMIEKITGKGSALSTQRITKDYVGLMKSTEFKDKLKIEFYKNNMYIWKVCFDILNYEISKDLKQDFIQLKDKMGGDQQYLQYEVIFSDSYPHDPPFIRVVFPRFSFRTGHVTVGGSICIQSLTPSGWSSARSLESYFVEVISLINAGNARLDLHNVQPYSLQEAKEAFNRVARDHGWLK